MSYGNLSRPQPQFPPYLNTLKALVGDGSDGNVILDGVATYPFLTLINNFYIPTRDLYIGSLVVNSGIVLLTNSWKIFVQGTVQLDGFIINSGFSGANANGNVGGAGGQAVVTNSLGGSGVGRAGANSQNGQKGSAPVAGVAGQSLGFSQGGGNGGTGGEVVGTAVSAGGVATNRSIRQITHNLLSGINFLFGGASGGSGSSDDIPNGAGGGSGSGGGIVLLWCYEITGSGSIQSIGGNGGNAVNGGAGGGGGGGSIFTVYEKISPTITFNVNGGVGGTSQTAGQGTNGTAGTILRYNFETYTWE